MSADENFAVIDRSGIIELHHAPTKQKLFECSATYRACLALSRDMKTLAVVDDRIVIWDLVAAREVKAIQGISKCNSVAFSPNGSCLAVGCDNRVIEIWDLDNGKLIEVLGGHFARVNAVAFSPDGRLLASASSDKRVLLFDARPCMRRTRE